MEVVRLVEFLESSFLSELLEKETVTDISYNGEYIFYLDNKFGRLKRNIEVEPALVKDFIRQIANLSEKQFSYQNP